MNTPPVDFDELRTELRRALRYGARARSLLEHTALVDILSPAQPGDGFPVEVRALKASGLVAEAVDSLDPPMDRIMSTLMCLGAGTAGMTLSKRRQHAADELDVQAVTFRSERRYEQAFVTELALVIYQKLTGCA